MTELPAPVNPPRSSPPVAPPPNVDGRLRVFVFGSRRKPVVGPRAASLSTNSAGKHRVRWIDGATQLDSALPIFAGRTGAITQFFGNRHERCLVAAARVDLHQLDPHRVAVGLQAQRFLQDVFGLFFAAVRYIDIGFGNRIDFVRVKLRRCRNEARIERAGSGVDTLSAGGAKQRIRLRAFAAYL